MLKKPAIQPFVVAMAVLLFLLSVCGTLLGIPEALSGKADFRQLYTAGYMVRTGHTAQIYDYEQTQLFQNSVVSVAAGALPFNHLAYESLLFVPLSIFSYRTAYAIFFVLNLAVLAGSFWMLRPHLSALREFWRFLPASMFACFLPVTLALLQGQDSIILLALIVSAALMLDQRSDLKAGMLIGLTLFKFQYALPIVLLFLIWRRWRFLIGFALSAAMVTSVSLWITGWAGFASYAHSLVEMSAKFSPLFSDRYGIRPQFMPNLRGFAYMFANGSSPATHAIVALLSALVLGWTATRRPSLPLALTAAFLVSYHGLISDMSVMLLPLGWALAGAMSTEGRVATRVAMIVSVIFGGPAVLLLAGNRFYFLALPLVALIAIWNGQRPSLSTSPNQLSVDPACQQTVTLCEGGLRGTSPNPVARAI